VDSPVVPVGLEPDGTMEIPGVSEAGWFEPGARPGAPFGSAVIAAHVDYGGTAGVFFDLRILEIGSEVTVTDDAGEPLTYVVTERFQVDKQELPVDELFRPGGAPTLTLITCGGAFDTGERSYQDNIVVRAGLPSASATDRP
jgi:sortase (surface protein transpeptidase)